MLTPSVASFLNKAAETWYPEGARKQMLDQAAITLKEKLKGEPVPSLLFVCTHNSRRSHFARVWAEVITYSLTDEKVKVAMESAGTEATACNERTVASLERAGFEIIKGEGDSNPVYHARYAEDETVSAMKLWSKTLEDSAISRPLVAVMTCSDADENCPLVPGASARIRMTFEDPKVSDNTPKEQQTYDERSAQIAGEMHYLLSQVY
ncbi:MAG: protein-tyrosine-phosphatase [Balneolia bacterium]|nr:protein-tyrosine-phosphatase [Balneolia bacterium]